MDAVVAVLLVRLTSLSNDLENVPNASKLRSKLNSLEQIVSKILPALPSAMMQIQEEDAAEKLLDKVNLLSDQLEKLLNKLQPKSKRLRDGSKLVGCFNHNFFIWPLQNKLTNITEEFQRLEKVANLFSASPGDDKEMVVFSRWGEDVKNIEERLLSDAGEAAIAALPIHGAPGIGKTTLARLVYNSQNSNFDLKAWILVSGRFEVFRVTQDVLNELGVEIPPSYALCQEKLKECASNKRFLLVMDQVVQGGIEDTALSAFMEHLTTAARGSRVLIVTTTMDGGPPPLQGGSVKSSLQWNDEPYKVEKLGDQDCWSLLAKMAFPGKDPNEIPKDVAEVGMKMVHKHQGNLWATTLMGRLLKGKTDKSVWEKSLKNGPWESGDSMSSMENAFMSYLRFSPSLKLCFTYCSILPTHLKLLEETLIQFWIAEGFVLQNQNPESTITMESSAHQYFKDLTNSFLLKSDKDEGISMPPEVARAAQLFLGSRYHFITTRDTSASSASQTSSFHTSPDTIQYVSSTLDNFIRIENLSEYKNLRTLLLVPSPPTTQAINSPPVLPPDVFTHFHELRTLSLSGLPLQKLPVSIFQLQLLQFLDLSHTLIDKLPDNTTNLSNLLTLKLNNCVYILQLPSMENLTKLRHLDISQCKKIKDMPKGIAGLIDLHYLSDFIVRDTNLSLFELRYLDHLSGKLTISRLQFVIDPSDARDANLANKKGLRELVLEWSATVSAERNEKEETEVLNYLKPCSDLETLSIVCYGGTRFPDWISVMSRKLVHLTLSNCKRCASLPLLGKLPEIKTLSIEGMYRVVRIGTEFCGDEGAFPSLETLEFRDMPSWEEWSIGSVEGFPRLKSLTIERCAKLEEFKVLMKTLEQLTSSECQEPAAFSVQEFPSLEKLDILHCSKLKKMPHSFPSLRKLKIWECNELASFSSTSNTGVEEFPLLMELDIRKCKNLKELPQKFTSLEKLIIRSCEKLSTLSTFPKLHDLVLEKCDNLTLGEEFQGVSLASMVICQLPKFICSRSQLLQRLTSLIDLEISNCVSLEDLTERDEHGSQVISSLKRLVIDGCLEFNEFPDMSCFSSLKELIIVECEGIESFPEMALPPVFKRLVVSRCKRLQSLPPNIFNGQATGLEFLDIHGCPSIASLSQHNELPESLRLLSVTDCTNLKSLPTGLNRGNSSLTTLRIGDCHSLKNFPHEGLPCSIISLYVINCGKLRPLSGWGLKQLKYLRSFTFGGCPEMVKFEGTMLPSSVTCLILKGLRNLTSVTGLLKNFRSLDILTIRDCPRLEMFSEEKLPKSISCLHVSNCCMLARRCKRGEGKDWSKIKHIPLVEFDFI